MKYIGTTLTAAIVALMLASSGANAALTSNVVVTSFLCPGQPDFIGVPEDGYPSDVIRVDRGECGVVGINQSCPPGYTDQPITTTTLCTRSFPPVCNTIKTCRLLPEDPIMDILPIEDPIILPITPVETPDEGAIMPPPNDPIISVDEDVNFGNESLESGSVGCPHGNWVCEKPGQTPIARCMPYEDRVTLERIGFTCRRL